MKKAKRLISVLLTFVIALGMITILPTTANGATAKNFEYEKLENGFIEIVGYTGSSDKVVIPSKLGKYYVLGISDNAFTENKKIKELTISEGVGYVRSYAFYNCKNLRKINLPASLVIVEEGAFEGTAFVNNKENWQDNALYINHCLIEYVGEATEYEIKAGTTVVADSAFCMNKNLKSCVFPDSLVAIGSYAFCDTNLSGDLYFPETLSYIGEYAFSSVKCSKVVMPQALVSIGDYAFFRSTITSVKLSSKLLYIPQGLFRECYNLETVNMPPKLQYIADEAFNDTKLQKVKFPKSIIYIGRKAYYSSWLKEIKLPDKYFIFYSDTFEFTKYENEKNNWKGNAFYIGKHLAGIKSGTDYLKIKGGTKYIACEVGIDNDFTGVYIPDSVEAVGDRAFLNCRRLADVGIPKSVKYIGEAAFGIEEYQEEYYRYANFKIKGIRKSVAHKYAKAYGIKFVDGSKVKSITLDKKKLQMGVGETYVFEKLVEPSPAVINCKWKSSKPSVVKVNKKGKITALKKGSAVISLSSTNGLKAKCKVKVYKAPSKIEIDMGKKVSFIRGSYRYVEYKVNKDSYVSGGSVKWSNSNDKVVKLQKTSGRKVKITALSAGTSVLTIKTHNGKTASCEIIVKQPPKSIALDTTNLTLGLGEKYVIREYEYSDPYLEEYEMSWGGKRQPINGSVRKYDIVQVSRQKGGKATVTGVNVGQTIVKAQIYRFDLFATCKVTVKEAPSRIKLDKKQLEIKIGETCEISSFVNSEAFVNDRNLSWSSSDENVVTVKKQSDGKALLVAQKAGKAKITVKTYNGKTASCTIDVI